MMMPYSTSSASHVAKEWACGPVIVKKTTREDIRDFLERFLFWSDSKFLGNSKKLMNWFKRVSKGDDS